jgi:hypothetical protein
VFLRKVTVKVNETILKLLYKLLQVSNGEVNRSGSSSYDVCIKVQTNMSKRIIFSILFLEFDVQIVRGNECQTGITRCRQ